MKEITVGPKCHVVGCKELGEYFVRVSYGCDYIPKTEQITYICKKHRGIKTCSISVDTKTGEVWINDNL